MSVLIPLPRNPRSATLRYLDYGADQKSPVGGAFQRLNRVGNRFAIDISYPSLDPNAARVLASALRRAKTEGALFPVLQPGLDIGSPGTPRINGAGQLGSTLALKGMTPGYVVRDGQMFSAIISGRRYLYSASAVATADGSGNILVSLHPLQRIATTDNAVVEFAKPYIEGVLQGEEVALHHIIARSSVPAISIVEQK